MLFALWYGSLNFSGCSSYHGHKTNRPSRGESSSQPFPVLPLDRGMLCTLGFSPSTSTSALSAAGLMPQQQYRGFRVEDVIGTSVGWCSALANKNIPIKLSLCPGIFEVGHCYSLFVLAEGVKKKSQWHERMWLASFRKWEFWVLLTNVPCTLKYSVGPPFSTFFALTEEQLANKQVIIIISSNKIYDNYSSDMNNVIFLTTLGWNQSLQLNNQVYSRSKGKTEISMEKKVPFYKWR